MTVGLVLVSHSAKIAEGLAELAAQMAPDVPVLPAGGGPDGDLGTDYDAVATAVDRADRGDGVVLLYDLGSAQMTAELVVEGLSAPRRAHVVEAPLVEGAVAAAVAAQGGADLDGVVAAAAMAAGTAGEVAGGPDQEFAAGAAGMSTLPPSAGAAERGPAVSANVVLRNEVGLHARPAALLARSIADLDAEVVVEYAGTEADARSVLGLMGLNARGGDTVVVRAWGAQAEEAVRRVRDLADRHFDE
ncbi:dihydroxyacetone kinase phosphoryl donor subunit DhaM [Streptoalloteichus hindustanus]|uniref:Phosphocarrier protein HPr n=1 Tax=Streptoalloteichus hindustanus TaxID=2017 RepID=A0A1M5GGT4_STRHI|nr:dihydroxyacetone kinase phosphoryl donor subunit DhaM [Streptoalloteichus hindustanus]SHG02701.1 Phosphocarrier protein HPr /dihydroxyacetone kinase DhaM subunit [Streptoalloteichus hindustanus]